jgi:hypothetical protein
MELKNQIINDIEYLPENALRVVSVVIKEFITMSENQLQSEEYADTATVQEIGEDIVKRHLHAFKELAK